MHRDSLRFERHWRCASRNKRNLPAHFNWSTFLYHGYPAGIWICGRP